MGEWVPTQKKDRNGRVIWDSWDDERALRGIGPPYWLRTPPIPPLLRRVGFPKPGKDTATLDLFAQPKERKKKRKR